MAIKTRATRKSEVVSLNSSASVSFMSYMKPSNASGQKKVCSMGRARSGAQYVVESRQRAGTKP
jgi:hypothetical protein